MPRYTIDHGTTAVTTHLRILSIRMVLTTMVFKEMFRKASVALVAGAYVLFVAAAQAQTRAIAGSPPDGTGVPNVTIAARIVLHGIRFQTQSNKIDERSLPILDYGAQILERSLEPLVYVEVRFVRDRRQEYMGDSSTLTNRRARAVVGYFEQRGISANRLVLLGVGSTTHTPSQDAAEARSLQQNVEVVQLVYVVRPFWTG